MFSLKGSPKTFTARGTLVKRIREAHEETKSVGAGLGVLSMCCCRRFQIGPLMVDLIRTGQQIGQRRGTGWL